MSGKKDKKSYEGEIKKCPPRHVPSSNLYQFSRTNDARLVYEEEKEEIDFPSNPNEDWASHKPAKCQQHAHKDQKHSHMQPHKEHTQKHMKQHSTDSSQHHKGHPKFVQEDNETIPMEEGVRSDEKEQSRKHRKANQKHSLKHPHKDLTQKDMQQHSTESSEHDKVPLKSTQKDNETIAMEEGVLSDEKEQSRKHRKANQKHSLKHPHKDLTQKDMQQHSTESSEHHKVPPKSTQKDNETIAMEEGVLSEEKEQSRRDRKAKEVKVTTDSIHHDQARMDEEKPSTMEEVDGDDEEEPLDGIGCMKGFLRDSHFCLFSSITALVVMGFLLLLKVISGLLYIFLYSLLGLWYVVIAIKSHSFQYLRNINTTETVIDFMHRMYATEPSVEWEIQCYHHETRTTISYYTDSYGHRHYSTTTTTVRVNTHHARGSLFVLSWRDASTPLNREEISVFAMTKVSVKKKWVGDAGALEQRASFIRQNNLDTNYDFKETLSLNGYRPRFLGLTDLDKKPVLAHLAFYIAAHLIIIPAIPYVIWLSSRTGKVRTVITKNIYTANYD